MVGGVCLGVDLGEAGELEVDLVGVGVGVGVVEFALAGAGCSVGEDAGEADSSTRPRLAAVLVSVFAVGASRACHSSNML